MDFKKEVYTFAWLAFGIRIEFVLFLNVELSPRSKSGVYTHTWARAHLMIRGGIHVFGSNTPVS